MQLSDILKKEILVDNQCYLTDNGIMTNGRLPAPITLESKEKAHKGGITKNERDAWFFLNSISHQLEHARHQPQASSLIYFGDNEYEHNTDNSFLDISGKDALNFRLTTSNLIGYVKKGSFSLKIGCRFGSNFLKYIISDADGFLEVKDVGSESDNDGYEWLLAYIWTINLRKAYRLGIPKIYVTRTDRCARPRGKIDPIDYFKNKSSGKYLCSYREHSYSSTAAALFIKAYESIRNYSFSKSSRNIYQAFLAVNQGEIKSRKEILSTTYFTNPYYKDYNSVIDLSKIIIRQQGVDFGSGRDSSGFFFDIAMLFEYFIRKLIKRSNAHLSKKDKRSHRIPTGSTTGYLRGLEPDLTFKDSDGVYIFDVKYKSFDSIYGVNREDIFQLHTYIGQYGNNTNIKGCGFIYPASEEKWQSLNLDENCGVISDIFCQQGKKIPFHIVFIKIPRNEDNEFNVTMKKYCSEFINVINSIVHCR